MRVRLPGRFGIQEVDPLIGSLCRLRGFSSALMTPEPAGLSENADELLQDWSFCLPSGSDGPPEAIVMIVIAVVIAALIERSEKNSDIVSVFDFSLFALIIPSPCRALMILICVLAVKKCSTPSLIELDLFLGLPVETPKNDSTGLRWHFPVLVNFTSARDRIVVAKQSFEFLVRFFTGQSSNQVNQCKKMAV